MKIIVLLLALVVKASSLSASSPAGNHLLSKARLLNNNDDSYDFTWVTDYSIKFDSCHTTLSFRADGGSGDGEDASPTEVERLVLFKLCPTDKCSTCNGGAEYLVEMREFVESYLESQMTQKEYNCDKVSDNCSCDDDDTVNDDDVCLSACYAAAGLDYCEDADDDDGFEIDKYLECENLYGNDNDDSSANSVYVGAYCSSNGNNIYLGAFSDRQCSNKVDVSAYETYTGVALPYTSTSIVSNKCVSCKEPIEYDDDANADADDADAVTEFCEDLYDSSAKCEKNLNIDTKVTSGCEYIHETLPRMESIATGKASAAVVWAWVFGITTLIACGAVFFLYTKLQRAGGINLSSGIGGTMS
jgi:hypothetical protein